MARKSDDMSVKTGPAMFTRLASFDQKRTELTPGTVLVREWDRRSHRAQPFGPATLRDTRPEANVGDEATVCPAQSPDVIVTRGPGVLIILVFK
jgi:hypothetical protein